MKKINAKYPIVSKVLTLLNDNVDTDQIIPARYLKIINKDGLGKHLFADWRYDPSGAPIPGFVLNQSGAGDSKILLSGENFGCGSSREHAPWSLHSFGFSVIIARSFADIFRNNAVKNGLLPIELNEESHQILIDTISEIPDIQIEVNLTQEKISLPTGIELEFSIDQFSKRSILEGIDELQYLINNLPSVEIFEKNELN